MPTRLLRTIAPRQLRLGMFIHGFSGAWVNHPFWLTRFLLTDQADVDRVLASDVAGVVIDERRGLALDPAAAPPPPPSAANKPLSLPRSLLGTQAAASFAEERVRAERLVGRASADLARHFARVHAGEPPQLDAFVPIAADVVASVTRNPYALVAITRLKKRDEYTYVHSLAVSALMTSLARTLALGEQEVFELGLAGLLHDIGKMVVPDHILMKPASLTDAEFALVRTHPEQGYLLLSRNEQVSDLILDVCRHHHERLDGTGYPSRLRGETISRAARIAAICDVYDALTSNRVYKKAWAPADAIARMVEWTGHFDRGILFAFMKTVGVFPPGLLVRMRSNRLAVTLPNGRRASRARVRVFYDARARAPLPFEDLVPEESLAGDQIMGEEYPLDWGFTGWPALSERLIAGDENAMATAVSSDAA
jgi:putative nucleotidyltransferase with HDIG domain